MHTIKIIAIMALTSIMQTTAMNLEDCCCLKLFFGYSYTQKEREYLESLKRVEALDKRAINERLSHLTYNQLEHIKGFIEENDIKSTFPKLYPLASNAAYTKDLEDTMRTLSTPSFITMRPMTRDNIKKGFHPGAFLLP